jgi:3-hydroxyacyl-CoA dehydrogenase / 3-hydroxy-2-methylbutyryl-CoA dehydrogenase
MRVRGKVAVITGGVSGLGRSTADLLVAEGAKVVLFDMNETLGAATQAELGEAALFVKVDVTDEDSVNAGLRAAVKAFGGVHICVNCAGIATAGRTLSRKGPLPLSDFTRTIQVNLVGTFNVMRLSAAVMASQESVGDDGERGVIINTASVAAIEGQVGQLAYAASKGGVVAMTLPAARDLAPNGIRVMCIAPGIIMTPMLSNDVSEEARAGLIAGVQFPKRLGEPTDYAMLVRDIAQNAYLNGEVVRLDGALRMQPR